MAEGTVLTFEELTLALGNKTHDFTSDTFKCALLTNATNPTAADVTPVLGDYTECTPGGNYASGGATVSVTYTEASGVASFIISGTTSWTKNASNPTNAYWGLIYNSTNAGKEAIAFIELAGPVDMTSVDLTITWGSSLFTVTRTT